MDNFYGLDLGKQLNNIKSDFNKLLPPFISRTSGPNLDYLEGMDNISTYKEQKGKMVSLQTDYNNTLAAYERAYVSFIEELFYKDYVQSLGQYTVYMNQLIEDKHGNKYFVNNYGILRPVSKKLNKDCPQSTSLTVSDDILKIFAKGPALNSNESCRFTAGMVKDNDGKSGFVDMYGRLNPYVAYPDIPATCPLEGREISKEEYNSYPKGQGIDKNGICFTPDKQSNQHVLESLNASLLSIGREMLKEIENVKVNDDKLRAKLNEQKSVLQKRLDSVKNNHSNINTVSSDLERYKGEYGNVELKYRQSVTTYAVYGGIAAIILIGSYKLLT